MATSKPSKPSKLYHFSPKRLRTVDPAKAQGKLRAGWFFAASSRDWAFFHVSDHQGTDSLYLHEVEDVKGCDFRRWRSGIYTCKRPVRVRCTGRYTLKIVKEQ